MIAFTEATTSPSLCLGAIAAIARQKGNDRGKKEFGIRRVQLAPRYSEASIQMAKLDGVSLARDPLHDS